MFGSRPRARLLLVASTAAAALLLIPWSGVATAAGKKVVKPTARVKAIDVSEPHSGSRSKPNSVVPFDRFPRAGENALGFGLSASTASSQTSAPQVLLNKPGLTVDDGGGVPVPDPTGAIGPNHYVEIVNSAIAVYDRDTLNLISKARLDGEFTRVDPGFVDADFFDPQIQWDEQGQRWLYAGMGPQMSQGRKWSLVFGWSKTSDPTDVNTGDGTSGWCQYRLVPPDPPAAVIGVQKDDYPKLGHSNNHIIIGANIHFPGVDIGARIYALPKPAPGVTTCPSQSQAPVASIFGDPEHDPLITKDEHLAFTPVPANTIESTDTGYVVAADRPADNPEAAASQIMAWHVSGSPNSPSLVEDGNIDVSAYEDPDAVPQPGTSDKLHITVPGIGARLLAAVMASDPDAGGAKAIWTQHQIATPDGTGRSEARWYELLPSLVGSPQAVRQEGTIASASHHVFNPAISPTRRGNEAVINYSVASGTQVPQLAVRSRRSNTPLGEMSDEAIIGTSDGSVVCGDPEPGEDLCRWGDYAGASPDPRNAHAVWGSNQLAGPPTRNDNWTSRNFAISVRPPRVATFEDGQVVDPLTGFDSSLGSMEVSSANPPGAPEGSRYVRAIHWPQIGSAQGRFHEALPNGSDVWYGAAFYLDSGFKAAADTIALLEWRDPVSGIHGGVSLRSDDKYHVLRGTANLTADTNVGPEFDLPSNKYVWLEIHQRLDTVNALTEVFVNGTLTMTTTAQNTYHDTLGVPTRISYGIGTVSTNAFQVYMDRATLGLRQAGAVGAPATPGGFTGSGGDRMNALQWNPVVGATSYRVYRQEADGTWDKRFDVATTAVVDTRQVRNCVPYRYRLTAFNSTTGLESVPTEPLRVVPKATGQQCPELQ